MSYLNIKIKEDFRTLKKGSEYKFDFTDKNYILQTLISVSKCGNPNAFMLHSVELSDKYGEDVVKKVWKRHIASEFKRKKAPIYIERSKYES